MVRIYGFNGKTKQYKDEFSGIIEMGEQRWVAEVRVAWKW